MSLWDSKWFQNSVGILEKGVDTAVMRRKVFANNIANVDVPNFKRSELVFESELKRALDSEKQVKKETPLRTEHPLHIAHRRFRDVKSVAPQIRMDYNSKMRNDGNNVDIEDEVSKLIRNQMQYNLMIGRLRSNFQQLNSYLRPSI